MKDIPPYPLAWPDNMARTPPARRIKSQFKATLSAAVENVRTSLRLFGSDTRRPVVEVVATSNHGTLGIHLGPEPAEKADPGVAVWFEWDGATRCIAVDRYLTAAENLQAIHHILEARRTEVRHGGLVIAQTTFRGFIALPAPNTKPWTEILGVNRECSELDIEAAFRRLARERHPDMPGGSHELMTELNRAHKEALRERAVA